MIKDISDKVRREFILFGREAAEKLLAKLNSDYMLKRGISWLRNYSKVDDKGEIFFPKDLSVPGAPNELIIEEIDLRLPALKSRRWSTPKKFIKLFNEGRLSFKGDRPYEKHYLNEAADNASSILNFYSRQGTNDLVKLGLRGLFDTPKPVELIKYLIRISTYEKEGAHILDFFAGSGTTGQAVMEVNIEDKKEHSFYLIQLDEPAAQDSTQYQYAVKNGLPPAISELMLHRLQTAKEKLKYPRDFNVIKAAVYEAIV
jgi:adenine-specific DNA-methyltransferase